MKVLDKMDILPKRDTLENWTTLNPIPNKKELICVQMSNGKCKWKIGDGKTTFNKLKFTNKISDIEEFVLYGSTIGASTVPSKSVFNRNCIVHLNPFKYLNDKHVDEHKPDKE